MVPVVSPDYPFLALKWQPVSLLVFEPSRGIPSPTTPQGFRFKAATSLPDHHCCQYLDDFLQNLVILKSLGWGALSGALRACSLAMNGRSGYLGAWLWCKWGLSFGLRLPSIYRPYLYWLSTVFPNVVFHSAPCALVVPFWFIDNLLIDGVVGFCPHRVFNLPRRCH